MITFTSNASAIVDVYSFLECSDVHGLRSANRKMKDLYDTAVVHCRNPHNSMASIENMDEKLLPNREWFPFKHLVEEDTGLFAAIIRNSFEWKPFNDFTLFQRGYHVVTLFIDGPKTIPHECFMDLKTLRYASSNTVEEIETGAFATGGIPPASELRYVSFPKVKIINGYAFAGCKNLIEVHFPAVEVIGQGAFDGCRSITRLSFPALKHVKDYAFRSCDSLNEINCPLVEKIGIESFMRCIFLRSVSFPLLKYISSGLFFGCIRLTGCNLPVARSIEDHAFYECNELVRVSLPSVESVGYHAFVNCDRLTEIDLPLAKIKNRKIVFGCDSLISLKVSYLRAPLLECNANITCTSLASLSDDEDYDERIEEEDCICNSQ